MDGSYSAVTPAGYRITLAESRHIPLLNAIERAAATIFPESYLPAHIAAEALPADILIAA